MPIFPRLPIYAQNACTALPVCDSVFVQPNINQGGAAFVPSSCLRQMRNPAWYRVRIAQDGFLGFTVELSPEDARDDYDFAVFDATGGKTCEDLTLFDERSCNYSEQTGNTGANGMSEGSSASTRGSRFNTRVSAKRGEEYLILISNYKASETSKGYRLNFSSSDAGVIDRTGGVVGNVSNAAQELLSVEFPQNTCRINTVTVRFRREIRCASLQNDTFVLRNEIGSAQGDIPCRIQAERRCERSAQNYVQSLVLELAVPITRSGRYTLRTVKPVLDLCGNALSASTSADISIAAEPLAVRVGGYDFVCQGGAAYLFADIQNSAVQNPTNTNRYKFEWSKNGVVLPSEQRNFMLARETGEYRLFVQDTVSGCVGGAALQVRDGNTFKPRINAATRDICAGDSVRLDAGADVEQVQWYFRGFPLGNNRERYLWVASAGEYSAEATLNGCRARSDAVSVRVLPVPNLSQSGGFFTVEGNSVVCNLPAHRYEWTLDDVPLERSRHADSKGQRIIPPRTGNLAVRLFSEAGCSISSMLATPPLAFSRIPARVELRIPDTLKATQNQLVRVPIELSVGTLDSLRLAGITGVRSTLRMNARLLSLEKNMLSNVIVLSDTVINLERRITAQFSLPAQNSIAANTPSILNSLTFRAMLGNTSATAIVFDSLETVPFRGLATLSASNGLFTLANISTRATVRLITTASIEVSHISNAKPSMIALTISPNPARERVSVHIAAATASVHAVPLLLTITDVFGKTIFTAPHRIITALDGAAMFEETIDTGNLPQGSYLLVVRCGAERVTKRLEVVR